MKLKRKSVKGMTLVEVVIALFIFTLLALLLVRTGTLTQSLILNTGRMNNKIAVEAPIGAVQDVDGLQSVVKGQLGIDPSTPIADGSPERALIDAEMSKTAVTFTVKSQGFTHTVDAEKYSTSAMAAQANANGRNCDTIMNGNLEFYVVLDPASP